MSCQDLHDYLTQARDQWRQLGAGAWVSYDAILQLGQAYKGRALPKRYVKRVPKACFYNARQLVLRSKMLLYCEGYCMQPSLPLAFEHAWALDSKGRVVDPTLSDPEQYSFYGITLADHWLKPQWRYSGVLRDEIGVPRREVYAALAPEWTARVFDSVLKHAF